MHGRGKAPPFGFGRVERREVSKRWAPEQVWHHADIAVSLGWAIALINALPQALGFDDRPYELQQAREAIVHAIWLGRRAPIVAAWNRYLDLAEAQVDSLGDEGNARLKGQIGLILGRARICLQAREPVPWVQNLIDAELYARNMRYSGLVGLLDLVLTEFRECGESLQAKGQYEDAMRVYAELEQRDLTCRQRGLTNLLRARCCAALLQGEPTEPETLRELLNRSLRIAVVQLDGWPEQTKALGMLDDWAEADAD
jgi:hypothetical protein